MLNQKMPRNIIMYQKIHYGLGVPKAKSNISPLKVGIEDTISIIPKNNQIKIIYSRVSSNKQKEDLQRQTEYLQTKYPEHQSITDIGSGINFNRKGLRQILEGVFKGNITEVVVAHKDRFTRFGYDLFEWIFEQHQAVLICDNKDNKDNKEPTNELTDDLMSIITVFTARYYGKRKYKKRTTIL